MNRRTRRADFGSIVFAGLDVAVSGLGPGRLDAQHDDVVARRGQRDALLQRLQKSRLVGNHVIGRENAQHRLRILPLDQERGQSAGRRSVARHWFLDNLVARNARKLVGNLMRQKFVGDNPGLFRRGQRLQSLHRLLDHGALAIERQHLLGPGTARAGPEAGSAATGKNNWTKINRLRHGRHILPDRS